MMSFNCNNYFRYIVRIIILGSTKRREENARESMRPHLSYIPSENKNKTGISRCGSSVVAYFQPATLSTVYK